MKKIVLLLALLAVCSQQMRATVYTNKTTMRSPIIKSHCPLGEYAGQRARAGNQEDSLGTHISATAFFEQSTNAAGLGKYFGIHGKNQFLISDTSAYNFESANLIQAPETSTGSLALQGVLSLRPQRSAWGVNLGWDQSLNFLAHGLHFSINMPIAQVTHNLRASVSNQTVDVATGKGILDYFKGNITQPTGHNQQAALTQAKFRGKASKTAVAGIDLNLGYHLVDKETHGLRVRGLLHIPTGTKTSAEYVFSPVVGNGRHVELGLGAEMATSLMHEDSFNLQLLSSVEMRYVCGARENRMIRVFDDNQESLDWGQYYFLGQIGQPGVLPAANVLPTNLMIAQGLKFDGMVSLKAAWDWLSVGVGYDVRACQSEKATIKGAWSETSYALAKSAYDAAQNFGIGDNTAGVNDGIAMNASRLLTAAYLDAGVAETPVQLTHKISAHCSFHPIRGSIDLNVGLFGGYQFATDNAAYAQYEVGGKVGMSF